MGKYCAFNYRTDIFLNPIYDNLEEIKAKIESLPNPYAALDKQIEALDNERYDDSRLNMSHSYNQKGQSEWLK